MVPDCQTNGAGVGAGVFPVLEKENEEVGCGYPVDPGEPRKADGFCSSGIFPAYHETSFAPDTALALAKANGVDGVDAPVAGLTLKVGGAKDMVFAETPNAALLLLASEAPKARPKANGLLWLPSLDPVPNALAETLVLNAWVGKANGDLTASFVSDALNEPPKR